MDSDSKSDKKKKIEKDTGLANDLAHWVNVNLIEHNAVEKKPPNMILPLFTMYCKNIVRNCENSDNRNEE